MNNFNYLGDLTIMKHLGMKPNFSELSRIYHVDRHTIAKHYKKGGVSSKMNQEYHNYLEDYRDEIIEKLGVAGATKHAVFKYFEAKYGREVFRSYSTFCYYARKINAGHTRTKHKTPHVFFETDPGHQLQVDWKENISMISKNHDVFNFNIFSATLGFSRMHFFIYSRTKTTEDFLRCLIDVIYMMGGFPNEVLTDNMTAVVSVTNGHKNKHSIIRQFEKDTGLSIRLCKTRSPQTKGKVESSNRFLNWLKPYNGEFENEGELIDIIEKIMNESNNKINNTTQIPPVVLFGKEKEYLKPIRNRILLESYISSITVQKVLPTLLVHYKGKGYSVPSQFINHRVKVVPIDNQLYIYDNTKLIAIHDMSDKNRNYSEEHYTEALAISSGKDQESIEKMAQENLSRFNKIGGQQS